MNWDATIKAFDWLPLPLSAVTLLSKRGGSRRGGRH